MADPDRVVRVVRVVPDVPAIHRRFDYSVPASMAGEVGVGSRVRVDLHGRRVAAWVVEDHVVTPPGVSPKPLAASSGQGPPPPVVSLAEWASWRWAGPMSSFLGTASPGRVVRGGDPPAPRPVTSGRAREHPGSAPGRIPSPGGGSVAILDEVEAELPASVPSVVRLAPALDATLVVLELVHRRGPAGVLVLVPSHARAANLADRLRAEGAPVALLPALWAEAATGAYVVVGTRAAAWAPMPRLEAAIVLDAHDEAYREERSPTWSAVDVVAERGRRDGACVVLVSPCPPVVMTEGSRLVTSERAVEHRGWPAVELIDRTGDDPRTGLFSERLAHALHSALDRPGGRAVCVLHRTGRIGLLACGRCGALARCTRCGGAVAQHLATEGLRCRRCGETRPMVCAECDATRLKALRIGVARATEELSALTGVEALEVTGSSQRGDVGEARLVVGTEAALHRAHRADVVAFLDIDQHLLAPRFAAGEETLALLARAARLVGTRQAGRRLLVQTRIARHETLQAAVRADPTVLSTSERPLREGLGLPPFGALAALRGPGGTEFADGLRAAGSVTVSSTGDDRWLVRASDHEAMANALAAVSRPSGRLRVEVDPTDV